VVKLFITIDSANPDSEGSNGRIPQSFFAERDYKAVIRFLIKYVDIMADFKKSDRAFLSWVTAG
jgi:hypothetical protein